MEYQVLIDLGKLKTLYSGLGQFSFYYGKHISKNSIDNVKWVFLTPDTFVKRFGYQWRYEKLSVCRRYFPALCRHYHLWHAIHQDSAFLPDNNHTPYILTIHDLNFLQEKKRMIARLRLHNLQKKVNRSSAVTFISNYTAGIARENLNLKNKYTRVIHNGVEIDTEKTVSRPSYLPEGKFLFTIGMVLEKKNFHVLIEFLTYLEGYNLVIAGDKSDNYASKILRLVKKYDLENRVFLPGIISQDDKIYLFRHCKAFLFPSKMEGFGLPVIEAMRFGKPVFISKYSSLPEIGGPVAYYWENMRPADMADYFKKRIIDFDEGSVLLSQKIKEYSDNFQWEKSMAEYKSLYEEMIRLKYDSHFNFIEKKRSDGSLPLRVLHLSSERSWRGGEQQIAYLIEELKKYEVECYVACKKDSEFEKSCRQYQWTYVSLPFASSLDLSTSNKIASFCRNNNIDILHMHSSLGHTLGLLSTYFGHKARLVLSRRVDVPVKNNFLSKWKYNHPRIDYILTVSDAIRNILAKNLVNPSVCETIHSGIDINKFRLDTSHTFLRNNFRIKSNKILIGNTSALAGHKDYFTFIDTAEYVLKKGLSAIFLIIGEGPQRKEIQNYLRYKKLESEIIMTGFFTDISNILPELDLFLMTSVTEGLGTSILDAFACRVPVVSTRAGGIPEMVIHGKTGLLSDVKDYIGLGNNILKVMNNPGLRKRITDQAYVWLKEEFSKEATAEKTYRTYMKMVNLDYDAEYNHRFLQ